MKLTVLGAGTIQPSAEYTQSGYLLQLKSGTSFVLDCGAGKILRLLQLGIQCWSMEHLLISHLHLDHVGDLPTWLFAKRITPDSNNCNLSIYGPSQIQEFYEKLSVPYEDMVKPKNYDLKILPFSPGHQLKEKDFSLQAFPMKHSLECNGYRIESEDGIFAYSGDTETCEAVVELGKGADIFILECSLLEEHKVYGHLTPGEAASIAEKAGCKHLLLSHFYPDILGNFPRVKKEVKQNYSGKVTFAKDLLEIKL